jgi:hypothetical protein
MELEASLLCSWEPAFWPYTEPDESISPSHNIFHLDAL